MKTAFTSRPTASWIATLILTAVCLGAGVLPTSAAGIPRPEHPRPDAFRSDWVTLNGEWQFEIDERGQGERQGWTGGRDLAGKITVPFCPESPLSGIGHYGLMTNVWYRRFFELPENLKGKRVRLHFGGVDYRCWVWVNGQPAGSHVGGNVSFALDISALLKEGRNELVVRAQDETASGRQPTGKQTHTVSEGCVYTRTTGIWQPVWLEAVGSTFVENFSVVPDPDRSRVLIEAMIDGPGTGLTLEAEAFLDGKPVGKDSTPVSGRNQRLVISLNEKRLWEPGQPALYDVRFALTRDGRKVDEVAGYFGLRKVSIEGRSILINGKRVFQRLILDQGFYPDGIWTAPSDEALRRDIELSMAAGYNGARLHQKVFEPRFLYWADKLGYLVWGEFPNWGFHYRQADYANYVNEWTEVLLRDRNHPSIVGWCPFNESGDNAVEIQEMVWRETRAIDPTRPILETSGWVHSLPNAEVRDDHDYNQDPVSFKSRWEQFFSSGSLGLPARYGTENRRDLGVPFFVSEFGGIGWNAEGGWGYGAGPKTEEEFYARYQGLVDAQLDNPNLFGFCYTQLTDVEQEKNGLYYYDRRPKFDMKRLHKITSRKAAYEISGPTAGHPNETVRRDWRVLVGAAVDGALAKPYRFSTSNPGAGWMNDGFNDSGWATARAPFGTISNPQTHWSSTDLWLRGEFNWDGRDFKSAALAIYHDETTEIYVNGQKVWERSGYNTSYEGFEVTAALKKAIRKGKNTLAVHTHQTGGGQFIDFALLCD